MWPKLNLSPLGLICALLWLFPVAPSKCVEYPKLLSQVKSLAKIDFLQSFINAQGLNTPDLIQSCKGKPSAYMFEALKVLPQVTFLQNVSLELQFFKEKLKEHHKMMAFQIEGTNNNVCCMLQSFFAACPTPRSLPYFPPTLRSFSWKLKTCQTIANYQSFMKAVQQVLKTWDSSSGQTNRKTRSLLRVLLGQKGASEDQLTQP